MKEAGIRGVGLPELAVSILAEALAQPVTSSNRVRRSQDVIDAWLDSLSEFSDAIPLLTGETFPRATIYQDHD